MTDKLELKPVLEGDEQFSVRAIQENFRQIREWVRKQADADRPTYSRQFLMMGT